MAPGSGRLDWCSLCLTPRMDCPAAHSERPEDGGQRKHLHDLLLHRLDLRTVDHDDVTSIDGRVVGLSAPNCGQIECCCLALTVDHPEYRNASRIGIVASSSGQ